MLVSSLPPVWSKPSKQSIQIAPEAETACAVARWWGQLITAQDGSSLCLPLRWAIFLHAGLLLVSFSLCAPKALVGLVTSSSLENTQQAGLLPASFSLCAPKALVGLVTVSSLE